MKQKRNYTLTEQEENKIVNQIYNKKSLLIKKLLETCHLTVMDLCVHLNIDTSTFHRWFQPTLSIISALKYTQVCVFFRQYIKKKKIPLTKEIIKLIEEKNRSAFFYCPLHSNFSMKRERVTISFHTFVAQQSESISKEVLSYSHIEQAAPCGI